MAVFQSKKFRPSSASSTLPARYRSAMARHPFALFGLPFIATIVAGSFFLTPAAAVRYEKHDRRVQRMGREEALGIGRNARKVDMKEEYYVSVCVCCIRSVLTRQKLAAKDLDDWEQKRVRRLEGEHDGIL